MILRPDPSREELCILHREIRWVLGMLLAQHGARMGAELSSRANALVYRLRELDSPGRPQPWTGPTAVEPEFGAWRRWRRDVADWAADTLGLALCLVIMAVDTLGQWARREAA